MRFFVRILSILRSIFSRIFGSINSATPAIIDEVEIFENILLSIIPVNWSMEKRNRRPLFLLNPPTSKPYLDSWHRYWVLSTPWPGHEPQRAQIHLYLLQDSRPLIGIRSSISLSVGGARPRSCPISSIMASYSPPYRRLIVRCLGTTSQRGSRRRRVLR